MRKPVRRREEQGRSGADVVDVLGELACTHTALRRAARRLGQLYDEGVAPTGLKATQVGLLARIEQFPDEAGPTLQYLSEQLAIGISALTHALRPLVRDGMIELRHDKDDKRSKHALLTALGRARLREAIKLWTAANGRVEVVLGAVSAKKLRALADQISSPGFLHAYEDKVGASSSHHHSMKDGSPPQRKAREQR